MLKEKLQRKRAAEAYLYCKAQAMQVALRPSRKQKAESRWKFARSRVSSTWIANEREDSVGRAAEAETQ